MRESVAPANRFLSAWGRASPSRSQTRRKDVLRPPDVTRYTLDAWRMESKRAVACHIPPTVATNFRSGSMTRRHYAIIGCVLLLGLSGLIAGCTAPEMAREEPIERRPYRIQVYMTPDKSEADRTLAEVHAWWDALPDEARPAPLVDGGLQPDIVWRQPYYRVRIGQFATREAAQEALAVVKEEFARAFIARERTPAARR